jgi:hypothetical protein
MLTNPPFYVTITQSIPNKGVKQMHSPPNVKNITSEQLLEELQILLNTIKADHRTIIMDYVRRIVRAMAKYPLTDKVVITNEEYFSHLNKAFQDAIYFALLGNSQLYSEVLSWLRFEVSRVGLDYQEIFNKLTYEVKQQLSREN